MDNYVQISEFCWRGITIRVSFTPDKWMSFKEAMGYPIAHLEIKVITPKGAHLPFTETGYRSHFISPKVVEAGGGPVNYVRAWLDCDAKSKQWIKKEKSEKQMPLF
ncbi:MAG: hypothetical protein ACQ9MH_11665 [Nitrospinales bacterium]